MRLVRRDIPRDGELVDALFDADPVGLVLLDRNLRVLRANTAALASLPAGAGSDLLETLPQTLAANRSSGRIATKQIVVGAGADERSLAFTFLPLPVGALLRIEDRTEAYRLEQKLAQSQRLQEVGQLAGGIAHDFNNLLTVILGGVDEVLSRDTAAADREDLEQVRACARRGAALVAKLLAFGRQQTLLPRVLILNDAIREAASLLGRTLGAGIKLELLLEEPGRTIKVDPTQLDQVLINLAVNARDAMAGQGRLTISTGHRLVLSPETLGPETIPPGRYITIEVSDTGKGIPPDVLPRIFEPFYTTKRDSGGTGLGLSTVHGIVRQSGGFLAVRSRVGEGTSILIVLPRHEAAPRWEKQPSAPKPVAIASSPSAERGEILLVEDEAPVRRLAERALTRQGWQVITAACAQDALDLLGADDAPAHLACVVSDVVMPGMDGPALVRALRETRPNLPAVLVSGYADASLRAQLAGERVRFLSKPFAMADLAQAVAAAAAA